MCGVCAADEQVENNCEMMTQSFDKNRIVWYIEVSADDNSSAARSCVGGDCARGTREREGRRRRGAAVV